MDLSLEPGAPLLIGADQREVVATIAALRTGQFDATMDYGNGTALVLRVFFDYGAAFAPPRLWTLARICQGSGDRQAGESIVIGERTWRRTPEGYRASSSPSVTLLVSAAGVRGTVRALLPALEKAFSPTIERRSNLTVLRWHDKAINADMVFEIDPTDGILRRFRRETRSTGIVLQVTYVAWNGPVEINPPVGVHGMRAVAPTREWRED